jgi:hypothetical protein
MYTPLTESHIMAVVNGLPIQGRIMLRLLLIQYLNIIDEDIDYLTVDRPDSRMQAGMKPTVQTVSREAVEHVRNRVAQYQTLYRQRRERTWLQTECLRKQLAMSHGLCEAAARLLKTRFEYDEAALELLKSEARVAIAKPAIRELEQKWDREEMAEEEYRKRRLSIEYQTELRRAERDRRRLEIATKEHALVSSAPLQDHEIAHIWGIPAGSLAARKVKYLHQYLVGLQQELVQAVSSETSEALPPVDLWRETFVVLGQRPAERSAVPYDATERTEAALVDKLTAFATRVMTEDLESHLWTTISRSLFSLQRLLLIQNDQDTSLEALEEVLLARVSPTPKVAAGQLEGDTPAAPKELSELEQHVLKSMLGG